MPSVRRDRERTALRACAGVPDPRPLRWPPAQTPERPRRWRSLPLSSFTGELYPRLGLPTTGDDQGMEIPGTPVGPDTPMPDPKGPETPQTPESPEVPPQDD